MHLTRHLSTGILLVMTSLSPAMSLAAGTDLGGDPAAEILAVQHRWAHINYELPDKDKPAAFTVLEGHEDALIQALPDRPEPLIWKAITLSAHASVTGGFSALHMVREARKLLMAAQKIDPDAMDGSIYTSLGVLYYKVPGWPLGFGDDDKAERLLRQALQINPGGIDPNYFYGDFLFEHGHYREALQALQRALDAPARPGRPVADKGRRDKARVLLAKVKAKLSD